VGAAAGLIVPGPARLVLWFSVTAISATAAGIAYDTRAIRSFYRALLRWLRRIGISAAS
jgi:hypothetical protein